MMFTKRQIAGAASVALFSVGVGGLALATGTDRASRVAELEADVTAIISAEGYTLSEIEIEDGEIEIEAMKDNAEWELVVDLETGVIVSAEQED